MDIIDLLDSMFNIIDSDSFRLTFVTDKIKHLKEFDLIKTPDITKEVQKVENILIRIELEIGEIKCIENNAKKYSQLKTISNYTWGRLHHIDYEPENRDEVTPVYVEIFKELCINSKVNFISICDDVNLDMNYLLRVASREYLDFVEYIKDRLDILSDNTDITQQQPLIGEQVKDTEGVQPIKDITPLKSIMNTADDNEFIKIINSIYDLVVYDHSKKTADKKKVMYVIHLLIKKGWLLDVSSSKQHYITTILEYFRYKAFKRDWEDFHFHDTETTVSSDNNKKYTLIFREVMENKNKLH